MTHQFAEIVTLIQRSRISAQRMVNVEMINLYWKVGEHIHEKMQSNIWGSGTIKELSDFIARHHPELKGFSNRGLYKMKLFYETYMADLNLLSDIEGANHIDNQLSIISPTVSAKFKHIRNTLLVKVSWSHHIVLLEKVKRNEERVFYIRLCINESYSLRELERQVKSSLYERILLGNYPSQERITNKPQKTSVGFKDSYVFEFLNLPEPHNESDLQKALIHKIKTFVLELGKDFIFMDQEFKIMVGGVNFYIDLLFYHRELHCLVAFELKATEFMPEYIGKLNFYLEALDRNVRKSHENPSVGILLCKEKNNEIVEFALSRNLSPAVIAEYQTILPDKKLLQQKLHELFENELA
ncbi:Predicted nuclease of restriction endonuclease-like (RecB) superfamily, DUF1016 family [Chitinophaga ginsengisegetis]|uniref:Predicted nuclease of restriction endonuclease-like (RecB) superfamily, DUF1016 family n=1 Tax=Chitinophaga ginsengisegetis TaxID=393003 RepID=A0A1T5NPM4_9BACT|nr:PDDEXK nuclease domain-containing protein [Chitinophaga ginsengisegetis]SKD02385.1 Predicted nuclease of restriction endonuclease-like (RecB) superfamily, DUF1016 family [Chitinophaga ginsengisegetis]